MKKMSAAFIVAAVLVTAFLMWRIVCKIRNGSACCGEREAFEKKIRVRDRALSHYPYHYMAMIDGMVCGGCVRKVENAFHNVNGIYVRVDLEQKAARVLSKQPLRREDAVDILKDTACTILDFQEECR